MLSYNKSRKTVKYLFRYHFEWIVLGSGLVLMATINPYVQSTSYCLFELMNFPYCPGEGLGHAIAFAFRGNLEQSIEAHPAGILAIAAIGGRVIQLWMTAYKRRTNNEV